MFASPVFRPKYFLEICGLSLVTIAKLFGISNDFHAVKNHTELVSITSIEKTSFRDYIIPLFLAKHN
jgi:hypothetical protein